MREPVETAELLAFTRVVEAKSLSRAAIELRVPRATIGRRLARLERRLGTRLLLRTTRSLTITDAGELFYRHAKMVLEALAQAETSLDDGTDVVRGHVRVSVPPNMDESFAAMLVAFAKKHPLVRVQVEVSARMVDLRRDGYDLALRATSKIEAGLVARTIARHKVLAVASPKYLAQMGTPRRAKDLRHHRCLTGFVRGELPEATWPAGRSIVRVDGHFSSNDLRLLRHAVLAGMGIALLPSMLVADAISSGKLVQVLPGIVETENRIAVVYVEREFLPHHVRAFVDALLAWAPSALGPLARMASSG